MKKTDWPKEDIIDDKQDDSNVSKPIEQHSSTGSRVTITLTLD